jgi:hypothetical protein
MEGGTGNLHPNRRNRGVPVLSSVDIKRELLQQSDMTGIRKRATLNPDPDFEQNVIDQADALEKMVATQGWTYAETYMMKIVMNSLLEDKDKELAKGMINLMHYIDQMIRARNQIFERREKKDAS